MLAAEAMRLAAIEALRPHASVQSGLNWPTLAEHRVYDSKAIVPEDILVDKDYSPCLSVYTDEVRIERRGDIAPTNIGFPTAVLLINVELAQFADEADEDGNPQILPIVEDDPGARLVLGAICAQVRQTLTYSEAGAIFRSIAVVQDIRIDPFSLPQFDIRWLRNTMRITCQIKDDKFTDAAGMPEPMQKLFQALPDGSYAKDMLTKLDAAFRATTRTELDGIDFSTSGGIQHPPQSTVP